MPSTPKQSMLQFVRELPDDIDNEGLEDAVADHLRYTRQLRELVRRAEEDVENGRVVSHEEAKRRLGIE